KHLLSCSVTFVGPIQQAKVRLTAEILRQGKSVTTIEVRLWQDDAVQSILIASFGISRDPAIQVQQQAQAPDYAVPQILYQIPAGDGMLDCYDHFELGLADVNLPGGADPRTDFGGRCRIHREKHRNREFLVADLMAIFAIWPHGVLPMFKNMGPASSVT